MTPNDTVQAMVERLKDKSRGWHPDQLEAAVLLLSLQAELGEARKDAANIRDLLKAHLKIVESECDKDEDDDGFYAIDDSWHAMKDAIEAGAARESARGSRDE